MLSYLKFWKKNFKNIALLIQGKQNNLIFHLVGTIPLVIRRYVWYLMGTQLYFILSTIDFNQDTILKNFTITNKWNVESLKNDLAFITI